MCQYISAVPLQKGSASLCFFRNAKLFYYLQKRYILLETLLYYFNFLCHCLFCIYILISYIYIVILEQDYFQVLSFSYYMCG